MTTNHPTHRPLIGRAGKDLGRKELSLDLASTVGIRLRAAAQWWKVGSQTGDQKDGLSTRIILGASSRASRY